MDELNVVYTRVNTRIPKVIRFWVEMWCQKISYGLEAFRMLLLPTPSGPEHDVCGSYWQTNSMLFKFS